MRARLEGGGKNPPYSIWKRFVLRTKSGSPKPNFVDLARTALPAGGAAESASAHSAGPEERVAVLPMAGAVRPKVVNRWVDVAR